MIPLNICFSQNMKAKIQGLGQDVRVAFESIENYIKTQDEKIEQLYKENAELKSRLEKSVELLKKFATSNIDDCDMCKNLYHADLCDMCGRYGRRYFECKYQDEFEEVVEEAKQALKGGADNE